MSLSCIWLMITTAHNFNVDQSISETLKQHQREIIYKISLFNFPATY